MKTKSIILVLVALIAVNISISAKDKPQKQTAVFHVEIHCDACIKKIEQNIGFEKGVKDMRINKDAETVTITYDPSKTDIDKLKASKKS